MLRGPERRRASRPRQGPWDGALGLADRRQQRLDRRLTLRATGLPYGRVLALERPRPAELAFEVVPAAQAQTRSARGPPSRAVCDRRVPQAARLSGPRSTCADCDLNLCAEVVEPR